jgi:hypothetical protein
MEKMENFFWMEKMGKKNIKFKKNLVKIPQKTQNSTNSQKILKIPQILKKFFLNPQKLVFKG